jgi:plasmid replication initiation protein
METISLDFDSINPETINNANIIKHNDLIEAKYQIQNLQEQRLILMLLSQIKKDDEDFKRYRITVADFAEILGLKGKDIYSELDRATTALLSRVIAIRNGKSFLKMSWLSSAKYIHGSGFVELAFDPDLKPYLLQLKSHFTQYKIEIVLHFKSIYSIRLYELLKKEAFKEKSGQFSVYFEYEDLRDKFGIGKKEYLTFNNFKQKTIEPATREISDKTDLIIADVKYGKTGRKITNITFFVGVRSEQDTKLRQANLRIDDIKPENESENHAVIDTLVSLGFSFEIAKAYKTKHGVKKIERNIAYTLAKKQEGKVKDIPAYLNMAIENDYGGAWDIENQKREEKKKEILAIETAKKAEEEKKKKAVEEQYKKVLDCFYALPGGLQTMTKESFISGYEKGGIVSNEWVKAEKENKNPLDKLIIKGAFIQFLIDKKICE